MANLDALSTLDTVIAMVVVLLILSLMVQALQTVIKKLFKLKSREIEKSLVELFENVIDRGAAPTTAPTAAGAAPATAPPITSQQIVATVLDEFKKVGRYTKFGRTVLDSISKEDLLKIMARVDSKHFYPDYVAKFQAMYTDVEALEAEINRLLTNDPPLLQGAASAKFAEMQEVLAPLINDARTIISGNAVKTNVLFGDLINLRRVKLDDALKLLTAAQESIAVDLQRVANNEAAVKSLQQLSAGLANIARILGQLSQRMDAAFATLRAKLNHVEMWYDTVMQSFSERYTRHMKNVAIYVSIGVVIYFNANFFNIYRSIATNDLQRALIVQQGGQLMDQTNKGQADNANENGNAGGKSNNSNAANSTSASTNANTNGNMNADNASNGNAGGTVNPGSTNANTNANTSPGSQPSASPSTDATTDEIKKDLDKMKQVVNEYGGVYEGFGFSPLTWQQVKTWASSFFGFGPPGSSWWADRRQDISTLLGWAMMVILLSVGAPFWQDTLESLFGVKNLLRKKSDTKNVETESGAGQPKA